jgi:hypothetical protein
MYNRSNSISSIILSAIQYIALTVAIVCGLYVLVMTFSAGSFLIFGFLVGLYSIPGVIGSIALLIWAVIKSIKSSSNDRKQFFTFRITGKQGLIIAILAIMLSLFGAFMVL